jgi:hypothetical protein
MIRHRHGTCDRLAFEGVRVENPVKLIEWSRPMCEAARWGAQ